MENELLIEIFKIAPSAAIAALALYLNHLQTAKWVEVQREISMTLGGILEGLRALVDNK